MDRLNSLNTPKPAEPEISVITVSYNSKDLLIKSLESLTKTKENNKIEIIVIDNGSRDGSAEEVKKLFPRVILKENRANLGFAKAVNIGIKAARGRLVLLLNPDTVVLNNAVEKMAEYLRSHKDIGIVGPKLLNPDGTVQLSCRSFPSWINAVYNRYSLMTRLFPKNKYSARYLYSDWKHDEPRQVDWLSGACLMLKREMLDEIGLFDEGFFMYCEDVDICYRAQKKGWKSVYYPFAEIVHYIGSVKKRISIKLIIFHHKSMYRFYKKHYSKDSIFLDFMTACGITAHVFLTIINRALLKAE